MITKVSNTENDIDSIIHLLADPQEMSKTLLRLQEAKTGAEQAEKALRLKTKAKNLEEFVQREQARINKETARFEAARQESEKFVESQIEQAKQEQLAAKRQMTLAKQFDEHTRYELSKREKELDHLEANLAATRSQLTKELTQLTKVRTEYETKKNKLESMFGAIL